MNADNKIILKVGIGKLLINIESTDKVSVTCPSGMEFDKEVINGKDFNIHRTGEMTITGEIDEISIKGSALLEIVSWHNNIGRILLSSQNLTRVPTHLPTKIKDASYMFYKYESFNQLLDNWNISNIEDMSHMFSYCKVFNQDISNWNTSKVKDMSFMFSGCFAFNQPLDSWDLSRVKDTNNMFRGCFLSCTSFDKSLSWKM